MQIQRHKYYLSVPAAMVIVLLVACGIDASQTPISLTREVTATRLKQSTKIPILSATMEPTFAYWATAQQAEHNAESTHIVETKQAISVLSTQYSQMCGYQLEGISISPDGNWIATDCRFDGDFFRVFQTRGNQVWDVPYSAVMKYYPEFIGSVRLLHWSSDGRTLYFTSSSCCADTDTVTNGDALYHMNLQTGIWTVVIEGVFSYFSFSPDGGLLIHLLNNQAGTNDFLRLHLLDLNTGNKEFIDVAGSGQGWVVWKDDGQKLALFAKNGSIYDDNMRFSLVIVNLESKDQQPVILNSDHELKVTDWSSDDILSIRRSNSMEYSNHHVSVFDVITYDLKANLFITSTPIP